MSLKPDIARHTLCVDGAFLCPVTRLLACVTGLNFQLFPSEMSLKFISILTRTAAARISISVHFHGLKRRKTHIISMPNMFFHSGFFKDACARPAHPILLNIKRVGVNPMIMVAV